MDLKDATIAERAERFEVFAGFARALDTGYTRVFNAAKLQWERHFAHLPDAADAIVTVRIAPPQARAGSGFLTARAQTKRAKSRELKHRFAR